MKYAPVLIIVLNRDECLKRLLDSLKNNAYAQMTDIYIGLDYPKKESHWEGYRRVCNYVDGDFSCFNSFTVLKRDKNYGQRRNIQDLIATVQKKYDRWITIGDDQECSPNFLEYMDKMLELYENDPKIYAVAGYSYPIQWKVAEGCNYVKQNFTANDWGIGYWREKYNDSLKYLKSYGLQKDFAKIYSKFEYLTDWAISDFSGVARGITPIKSFWLGVYDISLRIYIVAKDMYIIMPTVSKTRNLGFDGNGQNCPGVSYDSTKRICSVNYDYDNQPIDDDMSFEPNLDESFDIKINKELLNDFDIVDSERLQEAMRISAEYAQKKHIRQLVNIKYIIWKVYERIKKCI